MALSSMYKQHDRVRTDKSREWDFYELRILTSGHLMKRLS